MSERVVVIISVVAFINLTAINILSWIKSKIHPSYFWLGWMFFATSIAIVNNLHIYLNYGNIWFYHFSLLVNLSWGAFMILFINNLRTPKTITSQLDVRLFIPTALYLPFIIFCVIHPQIGNDTLILAKLGKMTIFGTIYNYIICSYSIGANIWLLVRELSQKNQADDLQKNSLFERKEILWIMLVLQLLAFIPFFLRLDLEYIILYMPVFGQIFFLYIFFRLSSPSLSVAKKIIELKSEVVKVNKVKYATININDEKINEIFNKMNDLMEFEKPFLFLDYSLLEMSKNLGVSNNVLSMVINTKTGTTFPDFINSYRIKHAIKLLSENNNRNIKIEAVAYDSGFSNRTTFYNAFKKHTGMLPSDFIKEKNKGKLLVG